MELTTPIAGNPGKAMVPPHILKEIVVAQNCYPSELQILTDPIFSAESTQTEMNC